MFSMCVLVILCNFVSSVGGSVLLFSMMYFSCVIVVVMVGFEIRICFMLGVYCRCVIF